MGEEQEERPAPGAIAGARIEGDTVRRAAGFWTPTVHALLRHLDARGFDAAPRAIRIESDEEVISRLAGDSYRPPGRPELAGDAPLEDLGRVLRRFHDATAGFSPPRARWQVGVGDPGHGEVICHNDVTPWNVMIRGGRVAGLVDFDAAAPGPRVWDLAYLAWRCVPLQHPVVLDALGWPDDRGQARRLQLLCDAYGLGEERRRLLDWVERRQRAALATLRRWAEEGRPGWVEQWELPPPWRHGGGYLLDLAHLRRNRVEWGRLLD